MWSACFDEYQYAIVWHDDLFPFGRNRRFFVLAQGFLDLLLDFQKGACCVYYFLCGWGVSFCSIRHSVVRLMPKRSAARFGLQGLLHGDLLDLFQR